MKKMIIAIGALFLAVPVFSQSDVASEVDFYQSAYGQEKKAVVENFMQLEGEAAEAFWAVYDAYETERREIGKTRINNLNRYIEVYTDMTDEQADEITKKMLSNRATQEKLYKKYFGKFKKEIGAKGALQFLELEVYLQTAISYAIMESIPFVGEL